MICVNKYDTWKMVNGHPLQFSTSEGKQPSIPLIYLGRKWTLNWWWWWWWSLPQLKKLIQPSHTNDLLLILTSDQQDSIMNFEEICVIPIDKNNMYLADSMISIINSMFATFNLAAAGICTTLSVLCGALITSPLIYLMPMQDAVQYFSHNLSDCRRNYSQYKTAHTEQCGHSRPTTKLLYFATEQHGSSSMEAVRKRVSKQISCFLIFSHALIKRSSFEYHNDQLAVHRNRNGTSAMDKDFCRVSGDYEKIHNDRLNIKWHH